MSSMYQIGDNCGEKKKIRIFLTKQKLSSTINFKGM